MTEAEIQLQNALTTTFLANLAFLSEYDNELYHRVDELSRMIGNCNYKEKYALEFIMESGDFDIYDIVNDKYLYNKIPKKINNDLVRELQFDEKKAIYNLEEYFTIKDKPEVIEDRFSNIENLTRNDMYEYAEALDDFLETKKRKLKKIKKFIFLGTLLGRHIPKIAEKVDASVYLICERNLEIFRLSLFVVDYTILANNKIALFSIMDEPEAERKKIETFINVDILENYLLKFSTTGINIDKYVDSILSYLTSLKPTIYDYNRILYSLINRTTKIFSSDEYKTILINKTKNSFDFFNDIPILYVAAGPSLDENIEWIRENQDKFFIVTIGAAYKKLLAKKIKIDIICTLDENIILEKLQFDDEGVSSISKDTFIFASTITHENILNKLNKDNLFLYEVQKVFHKDNIYFTGFSVGEIALDILLKLNAKEIYLIGLDLALNQKTGDTHSEGSFSKVNSFDLTKERNRDSFSIFGGLIDVKGNLVAEVSTTAAFYSSIKSLDIILEEYENMKIYNMSSNGAYFKNTIPVNIEDVEIENFTTLKYKTEDLKNSLEEYSVNSLSKESKEIVNSEIENLEKIINNEFFEFKEIEFVNYDDFYSKAIELIRFLSSTSGGLALILKNYAQILFPYLSFHFNNLKIKNEKKKVRKIKNILENELESIFKDYITCLKRV